MSWLRTKQEGNRTGAGQRDATPLRREVLATGVVLAQPSQDGFEALGKLNVSHGSQGIDDDVQLEAGQHQVHLVRVDVQLRLGCWSAGVFGSHSAMDDQPGYRVPG